jgi:hypothetical protein
MWTGWVGISPLTVSSTVAVVPWPCVTKWLPEAPLESPRLDQLELHRSQFSLVLSCK